MSKRMCFCDINPLFYEISKQKEIIKRNIKDLFSKEKFAKDKNDELLPEIIFSFNSNIIKRAPGVDLTSQLNKAVNIDLSKEKQLLENYTTNIEILKKSIEQNIEKNNAKTQGSEEFYVSANPEAFVKNAQFPFPFF